MLLISSDLYNGVLKELKTKLISGENNESDYQEIKNLSGIYVKIQFIYALL